MALLQLPAELKLQILADLPVRDIVRARGVCSVLRDVVDNPENHTALLQPGQNRALARLQTSVNSVLDYAPDTSFITALKAYVTQRGIKIGPGIANSLAGYLPLAFGISTGTGVEDLAAFTESWMCVQDGGSGSRSTPPHPITVRTSYITSLAAEILREHIFWHLPDMPLANPKKREWVHFVVDTIAAATFLGFSREWLQSTYWALRNTPGGVFEGAHCVVGARQRPDWPVTAFMPRPRSRGLRIESIRIPGCITVERLEEMFGVPSIPSTGGFAYCVKSKWAYKRIEGQMIGAGRFEKAAVLEEMYLY